MKKILCLGNNTQNTDIQTKLISKAKNAVCYGLLSDLDSTVTAESFKMAGYYHSSVYDIEFGKLVEICNQFDEILILDQSIEQWSHPDAFYKTLQLSKQLSVPVVFANPEMLNGFNFFSNLVQTNKSFCIFPFIEMLVNYDFTTVCCRSLTPVTSVNKLSSFQHDKNYADIRKKMIDGKLLPEHCASCYRTESQGIISARQQETVEWANRLGVTDIADLAKFTSPAYYEIRPSNKCNLQCRMCNPQDSHLIEKEYRNIGLIAKSELPLSKNSTGFEIINFESVKKIYVAGGEPTIMPEFYNFLDQCIEENKTDIEILVNTNGTKLSDRFKNQLKHFSNFHFIFSIDGFNDLNHYIRWPSCWQTIVKNFHYLRTTGHKVTVNTTVSIYNISRLHQLFEFIDCEFPGTLVHCQIAENLSPFKFPNAQLAVDSLESVTQMACYKNDVLLASSIDGYIHWFKSNKNNNVDLTEFFVFNDRLDQSRGVELKDYLPELDQHRPI